MIPYPGINVSHKQGQGHSLRIICRVLTSEAPWCIMVMIKYEETGRCLDRCLTEGKSGSVMETCLQLIIGMSVSITARHWWKEILMAKFWPWSYTGRIDSCVNSFISHYCTLILYFLSGGSRGGGARDPSPLIPWGIDLYSGFRKNAQGVCTNLGPKKSRYRLL